MMAAVSLVHIARGNDMKRDSPGSSRRNDLLQRVKQVVRDIWSKIFIEKSDYNFSEKNWKVIF